MKQSLWSQTIEIGHWSHHYMESVQIWSFFWSEYRKIPTRKNSVFGHFSCIAFFSWIIIGQTKTTSMKWSSIKTIIDWIAFMSTVCILAIVLNKEKEAAKLKCSRYGTFWMSKSLLTICTCRVFFSTLFQYLLALLKHLLLGDKVMLCQ